MSEDPVADEPAEIEEGEILFDEAGGSWWVVAIGPVMIAAVLIMEIVGGAEALRQAATDGSDLLVDQVNVDDVFPARTGTTGEPARPLHFAAGDQS